MEESRSTAVLLAAGRGARMGDGVPKQYRKIAGVPLIARTLNALGAGDVIDDIVMVIPPGDEEYIREEIFPYAPEASQKVRAFAAGGPERYCSVHNGLEEISWPCDYVYIHDGARPFIDVESLRRLQEVVCVCGACVAGMPSKDTVKIADEDGFVADTPDRARVWTVQTPQVFRRDLITECYRKLILLLPEINMRGIHITDDAQVFELLGGGRVKLVEASYRNIKITTPDDIAAAEVMCREAGNRRSP